MPSIDLGLSFQEEYLDLLKRGPRPLPGSVMAAIPNRWRRVLRRLPPANLQNASGVLRAGLPVICKRQFQESLNGQTPHEQF